MLLEHGGQLWVCFGAGQAEPPPCRAAQGVCRQAGWEEAAEM